MAVNVAMATVITANIRKALSVTSCALRSAIEALPLSYAQFCATCSDLDRPSFNDSAAFGSAFRLHSQVLMRCGERRSQTCASEADGALRLKKVDTIVRQFGIGHTVAERR